MIVRNAGDMYTMKLNELFTNTEGIFSTFKELYETDYNSFFGEIETSDFDAYIFGAYGNKTLSPVIELNSSNYKVPLRLIFSMFLNKWKKDYNALFKDYDFTKPYSLTETRTGTENRNVENNNSDIDSNKGFNSSDFVEKEKTVYTKKEDNTLTLNTIYDKSGNTGNMSISELVQKELEANKAVFYDIIIRDIMSQVTLEIYE